MIRTLRGIRRGDAVLAVVVFAGIVLVAWLGEPSGDTGRDTFASTDYRSGGYAAWFALMQRENVAVERFDRRPAELAARIGTLIAAAPVVTADSGARQPPDLAALGRWVDNGGRVVVLGNGRIVLRNGGRAGLGSGSDVVLLTPDGGAVRRPPLNVPSRVGGMLRGPLAAGVDRLAGLSPVRFAMRGGHAGPTRVLLADRGGPIVVERRSGRGTIVFVSDARPFDNAFIAEGDNARVAFALAQPADGATLAFDETIHGELTDRAWWAAIDVPTRVALGGIMLAIALALAGSALRLGPPLTMRAVREPASDEFIAAVAALYQRANAHHAAIVMLADGTPNVHGTRAELQRLAELRSPTDRDLIGAAALAHALREGA